MFMRIGWGYGSVIYNLYGELDLPFLRWMDPECARFGRHDCLGDAMPANMTVLEREERPPVALNRTQLPRWPGRGDNMWCEAWQVDLPTCFLDQ